jgi:hypothetical protein
MFGWVLLNSVTIWFSSVRVLPDHMVCQVMLATVPVEEEDDEEDDGGDEDDAAVPPQPAAAATTVTVASSAADLPATVLRCFLDELPVTRCSFLFVCGCLLVLLCIYFFVPQGKKAGGPALSRAMGSAVGGAYPPGGTARTAPPASARAARSER